MGSLLDIIASTVFGGILLITVVNASDIAAENNSKFNGDEVVQEMLVSTARLLEGEFRNMGFGVRRESTAVLYADSSRISFLCARPNSMTTIDTIKYRLGPTSELLKTKNELDRYLYRRVNSSAELGVGVVTLFKLKYLNITGDSLATPVTSDKLSEIYVVELNLEVQNPAAISRQGALVNPGERTALYSSSLWQQTRLASQNYRR
ncbi:MAG TPA: hypothetical protein DGH68_09085 [Bacteroidetes bacterium]|nr:hypothetical protein [Bacteroidota bacterium]